MLTPKQEVFAQAVAGGKTQADAYREAYNVKPTRVVIHFREPKYRTANETLFPAHAHDVLPWWYPLSEMMTT